MKVRDELSYKEVNHHLHESFIVYLASIIILFFCVPQIVEPQTTHYYLILWLCDFIIDPWEQYWISAPCQVYVSHERHWIACSLKAGLIL